MKISGLKNLFPEVSLKNHAMKELFAKRADRHREKDKAGIDAIQTILSESPQAGFWKCYYRFR